MRGAGWLLTGLLACGAVSLPSPAWAGNPERIAQMNKKAMASYDALEFGAARRVLEECVAVLKKTGMEQSIQAARTFINLGMVFVQMKDNSRGEQWFKKALSINPNAKLDPALATPDIQTVWDQAQGIKSTPPPVVQVEPPRPPQPVQPVVPVTPPPVVPVEPPVTPPVVETPKPPQPNPGLEYSADELLNPVKKVVLRHNPYEEVPANQKFSLYFTPVPVAPGAAVAKATLYYRTAGQDKYTEVPMSLSRKQAGDWTGQIPAEATTGRAIQYYMEAFDSLNRSCGYLGTADNPTVIRITASRVAAAIPAEDVEDPLLYVKREDERRRLSLLRDHVYIDVSLGTGYASINANTPTEVAYYYDRATDMFEQAHANTGGLVWAGVALRAELGAYLYRGLTLGISGRFEAFLNNNADSQVNANVNPICADSRGNPSPCFATTSRGQFGYMVLGKLRYQFRQGSVFRPYVHVDVGGGNWRGALNIDGSRPTTNGVIDNSSPYQPTDLCSAQYNGKIDSTRDPPGCSSIGGNVGYNKRNTSTMSGPPTNLNRVCPAMGPCIDAVLMGDVMFGGGFGFYAGGRHAGLSLDFDVITALGQQQFGVIIDTFIGPQFIF